MTMTWEGCVAWDEVGKPKANVVSRGQASEAKGYREEANG
jgi:hypothetical protein